jgi:hypothetical protein
LAGDPADVAAGDADVVQVAIAQKLQLVVGLPVELVGGEAALQAGDQRLEARGLVEVATPGAGDAADGEDGLRGHRSGPLSVARQPC